MKKAFIVFVGAIALVLAAAPLAMAADMAPLKIELPEKSFMGTPLDYWSEILEFKYQPREAFNAPSDAALLSTGKPITSSDKNPTMGKLSMLTDSDKSFQEKALVEIGKGPQWIQIDLEKKSKIYAVVVWHYHMADRVYFDFATKVANDADFTQDVTVLYNNDHDNSSGLGVGTDKEFIEDNEGKLIPGNKKDAEGNPIKGEYVEGRYVRLYSKGNTANDRNHYIEIEVYGAPAE